MTQTVFTFIAVAFSIAASADYFNGYVCTEDCSGHEAGYTWAEDNDIDDDLDCDGNSQSFIEGCESYVEDMREEEEKYGEGYDAPNLWGYR